MSDYSDFWNALAPFAAEIEDSNFDLASVRRLLPEIKSPVLVVGAGQGLIVAEINDPRSLISAAPEHLPYRSERQIENLFKRLDIPMKQLSASGSCWVARI